MKRLLLAAVLAAVPFPAFAQGARDNIDALIEQHAKANGVPASFVHAVVKRESNYNPRAKGGSALGLMQIKHATARGMGYSGEANGLYDPETNLRYGIAYLAGAYKTAQGNIAQAYSYYSRGYYYAAKRQGVSTQVAEVVAPVAASASAVASLFSGPPAADPSPNVTAAGAALAYAPVPAASSAASAGPVPASVAAVEVPLPPRRPAALVGETVMVARADLAAVTLTPAAAPPGPAQTAGQTTGQAQAQVTAVAVQAEAIVESVEVPLPPRRPSAQMLAAVLRPVVIARKAPAAEPVREATALPPVAQ